MVEFERLVLTGPAHERGQHHGERFADAVAANVSRYRERFAHEGVDLEVVREQAIEYIDIIEADSPEYAEEMRGIAEGSDVPLPDVALLNVRWEVIYPAWKAARESSDEKRTDGASTAADAGADVVDGCTSFGVTPPATADGKTYIGQNWDWLASIADNLLLVERRRDDGPDSLAMTEAGIVGGKIGVNEAGIGLCVNGLLSPADGEDPFRTPYHVRFHEALAADQFDDALRPILTGRRVCSANVVLGHADGEVLNLEAAPDRVETLYPDDGLLTHANHFESGLENVNKAESPSTLYRGPRLHKLLAADRGAIDPAVIQTALRDHFAKPASICSHVDESTPRVERGQTNASFVIDLGERRLYATQGPPCANEYREYSLS